MCSLHFRALATTIVLLGAVASSQTKPDGADRIFMDKAAQGNLAEVQMGQLAEQNAQSQQVKDFGARMVTDHTAALDKLKQIAAAQTVTVPTQAGPKDQAMLERMKNLHGEAFDKAYMGDMLHDHEADVAEFKHAEETVTDPQLKKWVVDTLPTLESHLDQARKIAATVGASAVVTTPHKPAAANLQESKPQ